MVKKRSSVARIAASTGALALLLTGCAALGDDGATVPGPTLPSTLINQTSPATTSTGTEPSAKSSIPQLSQIPDQISGSTLAERMAQSLIAAGSFETRGRVSIISGTSTTDGGTTVGIITGIKGSPKVQNDSTDSQGDTRSVIFANHTTYVRPSTFAPYSKIGESSLPEETQLAELMDASYGDSQKAKATIAGLFGQMQGTFTILGTSVDTGIDANVVSYTQVIEQEEAQQQLDAVFQGSGITALSGTNSYTVTVEGTPVSSQIVLQLQQEDGTAASLSVSTSYTKIGSATPIAVPAGRSR